MATRCEFTDPDGTRCVRVVHVDRYHVQAGTEGAKEYALDRLVDAVEGYLAETVTRDELADALALVGEAAS